MDQLDYLIDRKVMESITDSELSQLDQMALCSSELAIEIEQRQNISNAIRYAGNEELRQLLKRIHQEEFSQMSKSKFINLNSILSIAAIFILGISSYTFLLTKQSNSISGNQAYTAYYKPYQASFQSRGVPSAVVFEKFKNAYSNGNFKDALNITTAEINSGDIMDSEILLSVGISAMEAGKLNLAKKYFLIILDRNDYFFSDHAKWYLAMVDLKDDKVSDAIVYLKDLSSNNRADHNQEAKELLKQIM